MTYTPGQVGSRTHTITASYRGDSTHLTSGGSTAVTVTKRTTSTRVRGTTIRRPLRWCAATVTGTGSGHLRFAARVRDVIPARLDSADRRGEVSRVRLR